VAEEASQGLSISGPRSNRQLNDFRTKIRELDAHGLRGLGQQAAAGHAGDGVHLEHEGSLIAVTQHDIDTTVNFGAAGAEGFQRGLLYSLRHFGAEIGGAVVIRFASASHPWVLVVDVVEAFDRFDVNDRQHLIAENAHGQLFAGHVVFDQGVIAKLFRIFNGGVEFGLRVADVHSHAGTFTRWFDDEWQGDYERLAAIKRIGLRERSRHTGGDETLLAQQLVERDAAAGHARTGVADAALFQDGLNLAVLAKGAVDQVHGDEYVPRHFEVRAGDIHFDDDGSFTAQRLGHAFGGFERNFAFGAGAAHQEGDFLVRQIDHGAKIWNAEAGLAKGILAMSVPAATSFTVIMNLGLYFAFLLTGSALAADFDLLITNAQIADGSGSPLVRGSVAVKGGRIVAVGEIKGSADEVIDAGGKVVAPGFIDVHTHSENICLIPAAENFLRMGVTTIITGNCGHSRTDVAKFFQEIEESKVALNVATLIGHGSVREQGMGGSFIRAPNAEQLDTMKGLVDQAMKDGAVGLSTGLIYVPGSFAKTDELIALAQVAAAHDGIYVSHMRYETVRIFEALDEIIRIARKAKVRAEVSHIKLSGPTAWGKASEVLAVLDKARADGLKITHDQYAYTASSTGLRQTLPDSALEGEHSDFISRISDPQKKAAIIASMAKMRERQGRKDYGYAVIARCKADPSLNGKTIPEAAKMRRGADTLQDQIEVILEIEAQGGASAIFHGMNEDDLQVFLKHPLTMIASDGSPRRLGEDVPHPRSYGNNARVLGRYVRELKLLTLPEAVRRMTSLPAQTFHLKDRGVLKAGAHADIVIFDPDKVSDPATFSDPHHYAEGADHVIVNGGVTIRHGKLTDVRSGGPLRMEH
jgi:N-acyl-D-amino-acid deacylase